MSKFITVFIAIVASATMASAAEFHVCTSSKGKVKISGVAPKKPCKGQYTVLDTSVVEWNNSAIWLIADHIDNVLVPFMLETRARVENLEGAKHFKAKGTDDLVLELE